MDSALVAQILFANEKAFEGIGDTKQCHKLCRVCKAAKENQHIIDVISRNRAELEDLNNNIKEVIKTIPKDYYKRILNGTYNRQTKYIRKNKVRKYKNYKD
jgi:hypothetical protein